MFIHVPSIPISRYILQDIKLKTANDAILSKAICLVKSGRPEKQKSATETITRVLEVRIRTHVCVDNLPLINKRIVIPEVLEPEILIYLHVSHYGIEKTKACSRIVVNWIGMNGHITDMIVKCHSCTVLDVRTKNPKEPLNLTAVPEGLWQVLGSY